MSRQNDTVGLDKKKDPLEKLSLQPASTSAAAYQGTLGQPTTPYSPDMQIMGQTGSKKQEKTSDVGTSDVGSTGVKSTGTGSTDVKSTDVGPADLSGPSISFSSPQAGGGK